MAAERAHFVMRIDPVLRDALAELARANERSTNAEAVVAIREHVAERHAAQSAKGKARC